MAAERDIGMDLSMHLKGATLTATDGASTADRLMLVFNNGRLSIENPFSLKCASNETVGVDSIIGCRVTDTIITQAEIIIVFEGTIFLCISLLDEDFIGPEAASFSADTGEILVFI